MSKFWYGALILCGVLSLNSCNNGNITNNQVQDVQFQVLGTKQIQTSVGGERDTNVLITSNKKINNLVIDNLNSEIQSNQGWSLSKDFTCNSITPQKPCVLSLKYSPTTANQTGKLHFNYSYGGSHNVNERNLLRLTQSLVSSLTSTTSGTAEITYTSTTGNNVNASVTPNAQIIELLGLSQSVNILFTPDSDEVATNLIVTSNLSSLSTSYAGWSSSANSFSCATVNNSCSLTLAYTPTASTQSGTLVLNYTYYNNKNDLITATINIPYSTVTWSSSYSSTNVQYITANTVSAQNTDMDGIYPAVSSSLGIYLGDDSALGYLGPISQLGPLGPLGPLGSNTWNTSAWIFDNYTWADYYDKIYGPLSADGPLGENGPYTTSSYYSGSLFTNNQFAANTRAFGLWSILGPIGPLGAVGPLGALGPNGATGYTTNESGAYINTSSEVVRSISVPYNSSTNRTFDLYENYTQAYATQMPDNDTSFMVVGNLGNNTINSYTITSAQDQIVSALVVPNSTIDTDIIYVGIYTTDGKLIALSNSNLYINYVMFTASANTSYIVKVTAAEDTISTAYRLYVTGSYDYLNEYYIQGDYINQASL